MYARSTCSNACLALTSCLYAGSYISCSLQFKACFILQLCFEQGGGGGGGGMYYEIYFFV
tara:strand:- start:316 stop:495 length:180 start_codon:yes stop_codon:yes gene_type:complete